MNLGGGRGGWREYGQKEHRKTVQPRRIRKYSVGGIEEGGEW
jgi:hypothetical protein